MAANLQLDTTLDLLQAVLPVAASPSPSLSSPGPLQVSLLQGHLDSSEDEIFFGEEKSEKEERSQRYVSGRRRTLQMDTKTWRENKESFMNRIDETIEDDEVGGDDVENASPNLRVLDSKPRCNKNLNKNHQDGPACKTPDDKKKIADQPFSKRSGAPVDPEDYNTSIKDTANRFQRCHQNLSDSGRCLSESGSCCNDWFNTTREEMILYEKFGEDYDIIVEKMSIEEKVKLKEEVDKSTPKNAVELLGQVALSESRDRNFSEISSDMSGVTCDSFVAVDLNTKEVLNDVQFSSGHIFPSRSSSKLNRNDAEECEGHDVSKELLQVQQNLPKFSVAEAPPKSHLQEVTNVQQTSPPPIVFKTPALMVQQFGSSSSSSSLNRCASNKLLKAMPSYMRPTASSRLKSSPGSENARRDKLSPPRPCIKAYNTNVTPFLSGSMKGRKIGSGLGMLDLDKIISPVAQYISMNPPQILRHVKPKTVKSLDEDLAEAEEQQQQRQKAAGSMELMAPSPRTGCHFAPLPSAQYVASKIAFEQPVSPDEDDELPKRFRAENTVQAVVVRHVGRTRVAKGLSESQMLVEAGASPGSGSIKKVVPRPSAVSSDATMNESTFEMSIREVKEIKRLALKKPDSSWS